MREILFKAKRDGSGEWIEGCYAECKGKTFIGIGISIGIDAFKGFCTPVIKWFEVDPKTLCQFTGLCDKNGNKIWENDIVTCQTRYGGDTGKVVFHNGKFCVLWNSAYHYPRNGKCENYYDINTKNLVKGNIFDNPELLQEESDE